MIEDAAVAHAMGRTTLALCGAEAVVESGGVISKTGECAVVYWRQPTSLWTQPHRGPTHGASLTIAGTYQIARARRPFYVAALTPNPPTPTRPDNPDPAPILTISLIPTQPPTLGACLTTAGMGTCKKPFFRNARLGWVRVRVELVV